MDVGALILVGATLCVAALIFFQFRSIKKVELPADRMNRIHSVPDRNRQRAHWLVGVGGVLDGRTWWLGERIATVGRTPDNMIQVNEEAVSRTHCRIEPSGGGPVVIDLRSSNGTHVNGRPVERTTLIDGDILMIGNQAFRYEAIGAYIQDAAVEWKAAGGRVRLETQVGSSSELQLAVVRSLEKHHGDITAVTQELAVPKEMVELILTRQLKDQETE